MVAEAAGVSQPTAYKLIDRFVQQGLLVEFPKKLEKSSWSTPVNSPFRCAKEWKCWDMQTFPNSNSPEQRIFQEASDIGFRHKAFRAV